MATKKDKTIKKPSASLQISNSEQQEKADQDYFEWRVNGGKPSTIQDFYFEKHPGCNILVSIARADKIFASVANRPHDVVVGQCILKLENAHARANAAGDITAAISAAAKIAEIHRRFTTDGTEKENRATTTKPKWA